MIEKLDKNQQANMIFNIKDLSVIMMKDNKMLRKIIGEGEKSRLNTEFKHHIISLIWLIAI